MLRRWQVQVKCKDAGVDCTTIPQNLATAILKRAGERIGLHKKFVLLAMIYWL